MTQQDLANISEIPIANIRNYEQGSRWPQPDVIDKLADALKVPVMSFFRSDQDEKTLIDTKTALNYLSEQLGYHAIFEAYRQDMQKQFNNTEK